MALLDIFKKKKPGKAPSELWGKKQKKEIKKPEEKPQKEEKIEKTKSHQVRTKKISGQSYRVLKVPHITEKATGLAEKNQYVFKIFPRVNKIEVKRAIEDTYGVDVVSIKIINVPKKKRRLGKIQGVRPGYKKAVVKIKKGQKIEVFPR